MFKIYSVAFLLLAIGSFDFTGAHQRTLLDYIDIPITLISLTGFVAYAFEFPIGKPKFWGRWVYVAVAWDVLYNAVLCFGLHLGQSWNQDAITPKLLLANFIIFVPEYYALYLFGKSEDDGTTLDDGDGKESDYVERN